MYEQILYPTDGSEPAESVLDYALDIASEHDATIHILNVADTTQLSLTRIQDEVVDALALQGEQIVADAAQRATDRGVSVVSEVRQGVPSRSIVEYSQQFDSSLIVMPTHGRRGLERVLVGSITERVINAAEVPVITVNPDRDRPLAYPCQHLLVPTDGSRGAELALTEGIAVASATGATLHLLYVVESGSLGLDVRSVMKEDVLAERANAVLEEATETATESVDAVESEIAYGSPAKEIRTYIRSNEIDLAILGTHGTTDFSRYMMGGVSSKIVRTSPIPVMWVREPEGDG